MKECSVCKETKEFSSFWKRKQRPSGYASACKDCSNKIREERKKADPEHHKEVLNKWAANNKDKLKAINARYVKKNREKVNENQRRWYKKNGQKRIYTPRLKEWLTDYRKENEYLRKRNRATTVVWRALQTGKLSKPEECQICKKKEKLDGHHGDYDKPLEVTWLCRFCHAEIHRKIRS